MQGDIYNAMQRAIARATQESGAFTGIEESKRAQYIKKTARMFANQTLAKANQRGNRRIKKSETLLTPAIVR